VVISRNDIVSKVIQNHVRVYVGGYTHPYFLIPHHQ